MTAYFWDDPKAILYIIIAFLVLDNLWAIYLLLREINVAYKAHKVPTVISPYLPQELYDKMRVYKIHKGWFTIVNTLVTAVIMGVLELYLGFYAWLYGVAGQCAMAKWMEHEACVSVIFVLLLSFYLWLKMVPAMIYEKMCITSVQSRAKPSWLMRICHFVFDLIVGTAFTIVVVVALVFMFLSLGPYAPLGLYGQTLILTFFILLLIPCLIDPLMGKRVPLESSNLRTQLEQLTRQVGFPMRQVYIIRVHDPNTGSNAFFYGCCCLKRIVIFDTLLLNRGKRDLAELSPEEMGKGLTDSQVTAVVAHELGHWRHGHFYKAIMAFQVHLILTILLFAVLFPHGPIYQAVGFAPGLQPIVVGCLIIFGFVMTPYMTLANFSILSMTRCFEYQADRFAYQLGYAGDLGQALLKLYADNLAFPVSDFCYSSWNHTHPTMLDRLAHLEELRR
ncbi:CAAX prenyl protease 1 homolog [Drosophila gunungcola]|uniref:CAAX prenyl protease 1 homolog n=1 Tax=Drosophila gunungcola TaxID=103775 RepID=UPI0022E8081C|nr:CAAX prenyl protease 1 homolog [Drosophila gunungcola]